MADLILTVFREMRQPSLLCAFELRTRKLPSPNEQPVKPDADSTLPDMPLAMPWSLHGRLRPSLKILRLAHKQRKDVSGRGRCFVVINHIMRHASLIVITRHLPFPATACRSSSGYCHPLSHRPRRQTSPSVPLALAHPASLWLPYPNQQNSTP